MILQLETCTECNLKCTFCYKTQNKKQIKKNIMSVEDVKKIFSKENNYEKLLLFNNGEFFCNPQWKEILSYICSEIQKSGKNTGVDINTNGILLDYNNINFIIDIIKKTKVFLTVVFSINAFNEETYLKLSGKNYKNIVYDNAENFIKNAVKFNAEENKNIISTAVQFVINPENREEISDFLNYWIKIYKKNNIMPEICEDSYVSSNPYTVRLRKLNTADIYDDDFFYNSLKSLQKDFDIKIETKSKIEKGENYFKRMACKLLFESNIWQNDKKALCCKDINYEYKNENVILNEYYRYLHIFGFFDRIKLCYGCINYEGITVDEINQYIENEKIIENYKKRLQTGLFFENYSKMDLKNVKKEKDFCVLKLENKCKKNQLNPDYCKICEEKASFYTQQDRLRAFGYNSFFSPLTDKNKEEKNIEKIYNMTCQKDFEKVKIFLEKNHNIYYYRLFLEYAVSFNLIENFEVFEIFINTDIPEIIEEYGLKTNDFFEKILIILSEKFPEYYLSYPAIFKSVKFEQAGYFENEKIKKLAKNFLKYVYDIQDDLDFKSALYDKTKLKTEIDKILFSEFEKKKNFRELIEMYKKNMFYSKNHLINTHLNYYLNNEIINCNQSDKLVDFYLCRDYPFFKNSSECIQHKIIEFIDKRCFKDIFKILPFFEQAQKAFENEFGKMIEEKKFYTLSNLIIDNKKYFINNKNIIDRIFNYDSNRYSVSFTHFLILAGVVFEKKDLSFYLIYSYYMKQENFSPALKYLEKIKNPEMFFDKVRYIKTVKYIKSKINL